LPSLAPAGFDKLMQIPINLQRCCILSP